MRAPLAALLAIAALAVAGCGGDDESAQTTPTKPELTVPGGSDPGLDGTTGTDETDTGTDTGSGGTAAPPAQAPTTPPAQQPQDSPQNDQPPPAGSPAQRFENFCDENPGAC